jgi:hypothetical protein
MRKELTYSPRNVDVSWAFFYFPSPRCPIVVASFVVVRSPSPSPAGPVVLVPLLPVSTPRAVAHGCGSGWWLLTVVPASLPCPVLSFSSQGGGRVLGSLSSVSLSFPCHPCRHVILVIVLVPLLVSPSSSSSSRCLLPPPHPPAILHRRFPHLSAPPVSTPRAVAGGGGCRRSLGLVVLL